MGGLRALLLNRLFQVIFSLLISVIGAMSFWWMHGGALTSPFDTLVTLHQFAFGLGAILALVGPLMFAFAMQHADSTMRELSDLHLRFRELVEFVYAHLETLEAQGKVDHGYKKIMEPVRSSPKRTFLHFDRKDWWDTSMTALKDWLDLQEVDQSEQDADGYRSRILISLLEGERVINELNVNALRRLFIRSDYAKTAQATLWSILALLVLVGVSLVAFTPVVASGLFVAMLFITSLSAFFVFQLIFGIGYEMREISPDERDEDDNVEEDGE